MLSDAAEARRLRPVRPRRARGQPQGGGGGVAGAEAFGDIFGEVFGDIFGGARRGGRAPGVSRRRPALRARTRPGRGGVRPHTSRSRSPRSRVRDLPRQRRRQGQQRRCSCDDLRRRRPGARAAGLLHAPADLPALPRQRAHRRAIPATPASGRAAYGAAQARRSRCRPVSTPATAIRLSARARPAATAGRPGTCTSRCRCASTRSSSARAHT